MTVGMLFSCKHLTAADMRLALSIVLPGRLKASLAETAEITGASQATVSRLRQNLLAGKRPALNWKSGWGGRRRGNLSEEQEERFVEKWNRETARF
ncbi:MAG: hypothetical protein WCP55_16310 [Lentisphaerota bacterium]